MPIFPLLFSALLSSLMLSLGIPNELFLLGSSIFGIFSLVPLYIALTRAKSFAVAGILCGAQIACVHLFSSFWLANFKDFAIFTLGASTIAYFGLGISTGWCLKAMLCLQRSVRPFAFAAYWVCWEWLKSTGFVGYPWGTLPLSALGMRCLIQIADTTGVWGISFLFALASAVAAEILLPENKTRIKEKKIPAWRNIPINNDCLRALAFALALFFLSLVYGYCALSAIPAPDATFAATLVQQNTDPWGGGKSRENALLDLQNLTREAISSWEASGQKPDIIIWSESSIPYSYNINKHYYSTQPEEEPFISFLEDVGIPIFTGSSFIESANGRRKAFNAALLINPNGAIVDWYGKMQLVPFAEYVPFSENELFTSIFGKIVGFSSGWTPGNRRTVFSIAARGKDGKEIKIPFTAPICFEDAFPAVTARLHKAGGKLLINITNDSWSKTASAEYQHYAVASFRAIELRTTLIRSTNGGFTAVILPSGEILAALPLFQQAFLNAEIPVYPVANTFYAEFGEWLVAICAISSLLCLAISSIKIKRQPRLSKGEFLES